MYRTILIWALMLVPAGAWAKDSEPLRVCATIPDLGSLVQEVGGNRVTTLVFVKGTEDPHTLEARPSFVKELNRADLLVLDGLELEIGWLPVLQKNARNARVLAGAAGYLDASQVVPVMEVPEGRVDRSMGDVHASGNPHYLSDPILGLKVARLIADKLVELRPAERSYFKERYADFHKRLGRALAGKALASKYDVEKLATLQQHNKLLPFLESQKERKLLGGWFGLLAPYYGTKAVDDHSVWPYFARRFGIRIVGHLEPKPGIPPTTRHLALIVKAMKAQGVALVVNSAYYDPKHAAFIAKHSGAKVVRLAHQVGALSGASTYLKTVDLNVRRIAAELGKKR